MGSIPTPRVVLPRVIVAVLALSFVPMVGAASAYAVTPKTATPVCVVHSAATALDQGLGDTNSSIADIIQVECLAIYSEQTVTIDATQLNDACDDTLSWLAPNSAGPDPEFSEGAQFEVTLDDDGNATAVLWGGPSCAPSKDRISASLNAPPYSTAATSVTVLPPHDTKVGVTSTPANEVEDSVYSSVATVIQVELPSVYSEKSVILKSDELYTRCDGELFWYGADESILNGGDSSPEATVTLDNNGNAFAVAIGSESCASGKSTVTADLTTVPYTTLVGSFTILSPRVTDVPPTS